MSEYNGNITKHAFFSAAGIYLSRIIGLIREILMAALFGTGMIADAFSVANVFPNMLRRVFGEGGLLVVMLPIYTQKRLQESDKAAYQYASSVAVLLFFVVLIVIIASILIAPVIASIAGWGWVGIPEKFQLTLTLLRTLFWGILFISFSTWASAILNAHKKFFIPTVSAAIANLFWVFGLLIVMYFFRNKSATIQAMTVAFGILAGGLFQFLLQVTLLRKIGFKFKSNLKANIKDLILTGKLLIPALFALGVGEINVLVDYFLASLLTEGSVAALTYAHRLVHLPMGLGIAMSYATLPVLSNHAVSEDKASFRKSLYFSTSTIFAILLPITAYIIVLNKQIVRVLLERGSFSAAISTPLTSGALVMYAIGLLAFGANKTLIQGFYAVKDTKTPLFIGAAAMILNVGLNFALVGSLQHRGLALASSIANIFYLIFLIVLLSKKKLANIMSYVHVARKYIIFSTAVGFITYISGKLTILFLPGTTFLMRIIQLGIPSLIWLVTIIILAEIFEISEIKHILSKMKFWKK